MIGKLLTACLLVTAIGSTCSRELAAQTLPASYWPSPQPRVEQRRVLTVAASLERIHLARQKFRQGAFQEAQQLLASKDELVRTDESLGQREAGVAKALISLFAGEFRQALTFAEQAQSAAVPECPVCGFADARSPGTSPDESDVDAALVKAVLFAEVKMEGLTTAWAKWVKQQSPQTPLADYLLQALEQKQLKYGHLAVPAVVPGSHVDFFFERNPQADKPVQMIFSQHGKYAGTLSLVRYRSATTATAEYRLVFFDLEGAPLTVREFGHRGPALPTLQALASHRFYSLDESSRSSLRAELETYVADQKEVAPLASIWLTKTRSPLAADVHRTLVNQQLAEWELTCMKNVGEIIHPVDGQLKIYWIAGFRNLGAKWTDLARLEAGEFSPELYHFAIFGHEPHGYVASYVVKAIAQGPGEWSYCLMRRTGGGTVIVHFYDRPPQNELPETDPGTEVSYLRSELHDQAVADVERLIDEELANLK